MTSTSSFWLLIAFSNSKILLSVEMINFISECSIIYSNSDIRKSGFIGTTDNPIQFKANHISKNTGLF